MAVAKGKTQGPEEDIIDWSPENVMERASFDFHPGTYQIHTATFRPYPFTKKDGTVAWEPTALVVHYAPFADGKANTSEDALVEVPYPAGNPDYVTASEDGRLLRKGPMATSEGPMKLFPDMPLMIFARELRNAGYPHALKDSQAIVGLVGSMDTVDQPLPRNAKEGDKPRKLPIFRHVLHMPGEAVKTAAKGSGRPATRSNGAAATQEPAEDLSPVERLGTIFAEVVTGRAPVAKSTVRVKVLQALNRDKVPAEINKAVMGLWSDQEQLEQAAAIANLSFDGETFTAAA